MRMSPERDPQQQKSFGPLRAVLAAWGLCCCAILVLNAIPAPAGPQQVLTQPDGALGSRAAVGGLGDGKIADPSPPGFSRGGEAQAESEAGQPAQQETAKAQEKAEPTPV